MGSAQPPPAYQEALSSPSAPPRQPDFPPNATPVHQLPAAYVRGGVVYSVQPQTVIVAPNVVIVKNAHSFHPYPEFCPKCQTIVVTRRLWVSGSCACTVLILSLCIPFLWPMLCFLFSPAFKDAHHHCPYCLTLLSIRRR